MSLPGNDAGEEEREMPRYRPLDSSIRVVKSRGGDPLRLETSLDNSPQFPVVSMVPTPLIPQPSTPMFPPIDNAVDTSNQRIVSMSTVPDSRSLLQGPNNVHRLSSREDLHQDRNTRKTDERTGNLSSLHRGNSLVVPKRGERSVVHLSRSVSVGGPQRQPSTFLHREPKAAGSSIEDLPEEVYLARNSDGAQTAWTRINFVGKGSFSEVVLSRPAIEFVKPEFAQEVDELATKELKRLEEEPGIDAPKIEATDASEFEQPTVLVAVKITTLNCAKPQAQLDYFKRDLDIMSTLPHHPSLLRMIGSSVDQDHHKRAIFVLPYCPGGDLFDLVAKNRSKLSSLLIRRLFADICSAVAFLHENHIVHRDIKLENVLLDVKISTLLRLERPDLYSGPLAVITDLGLARRIDPADPLLKTRCGSDDYVPPEIMLGQPYDGRETDSWALGVLLYAMLEGRLPFDAPPQTAQFEGSRSRLKTAHRIARVDWNWYKRKDESDAEWKGGMEIVEACLRRRTHRRLAKDTLKEAWVANAIPNKVIDPHSVDNLWQIFVQ